MCQRNIVGPNWGLGIALRAEKFGAAVELAGVVLNVEMARI